MQMMLCVYLDVAPPTCNSSDVSIASAVLTRDRTLEKSKSFFLPFACACYATYYGLHASRMRKLYVSIRFPPTIFTIDMFRKASCRGTCREVGRAPSCSEMDLLLRRRLKVDMFHLCKKNPLELRGDARALPPL